MSEVKDDRKPLAKALKAISKRFGKRRRRMQKLWVERKDRPFTI